MKNLRVEYIWIYQILCK